MNELSDERVASFEVVLRQLQEELREALRPLREGARTVDLDQPIGRLTRVDALQQQSMAKANRQAAQVRLRLVGAALQRIGEGTYGYCLECDEPIGETRLSVRPEAFLCIECQEVRER